MAKAVLDIMIDYLRRQVTMPAMAHRGAYRAGALLGLEERPRALPKVVGRTGYDQKVASPVGVRTGVVFDSRLYSRPEPPVVGSAPMCPIPRAGIGLLEGAVIEINSGTVSYSKKPVVVGSTETML